MRLLLNSRWLLFVNTLPVGLLLLLGYAQYTLVETLLPVESRHIWGALAVGIIVLGIVTLAYTFYQQRRQQPVGLGYCVLALVATITWLTWAMGQDRLLIPFDIPQWLVPTDVLLYAYTFLMPTLAHAVLVAVVILTPPTRRHSALSNFGLAILAPGIWGLVMGVGGRLLFRLFQWQWLGTLVFTGSTTVFLFFLVRAAYVMHLNRQSHGESMHVRWKGAVALVCPILGLLVNSGFLLGDSHIPGGVFGNFSSWWFYAFALLNGIVVCWPEPTTVAGQRALLLGRSFTFPFTAYFFLVFLPFLPLALPAIVLLGLGFLMLTPLVLGVVHSQALYQTWQQLRPTTAPVLRWALLVSGLLILPLGLTGSYLYQRVTLNQALAYRYAPDYQKHDPIDEEALGYTLQQIRANKESDNAFLSSHQMPYLSMYFNWLVLDNLMLSESKLADLERVFGQVPVTGDQPTQVNQPAASPSNPSTAHITNVRSHSTFDAHQQVWVSEVELEVQNQDPQQQDGEFISELELPVGCWVGDYTLDINGRREHGILAEKKAAAWVYAQIRNERRQRDPGLLTYEQPRHLRLRVYPVLGRTPRRTSFQLLHPEPIALKLDDRLVPLGHAVSRPTHPVATANRQVVYLSGADKQQLPRVQRKPYYHFLLDASADASIARKSYAAALRQQFGAEALRNSRNRFWLVDAYRTPVSAGQHWETELLKHQGHGGFFLEGALRQLLVEAYLRPQEAYPIPVVVTADGTATNHVPSLADLQAAFPESDRYYVLTADQLTAHSLLKNQSPTPVEVGAKLSSATKVRAWPARVSARAYLPDNEAADIVLSEPAKQMDLAPATNNRWQLGLLLHGYQQWLSFHPEVAEAQRVPFLQASFRSGILTSLTAYIALENEAQKEALRRKQQQVLNAASALDLSEEPATAVPLDDYAGLLLVAGVVLALWQLRRSG